MNPFWLLQLTRSNTSVLWIVGTLAMVGVVLISRSLRQTPWWRAVVIGIAAMLLVSPVHSVTLDPWWRAPWPSVYITAAFVVGAFDSAGAYFERDFIMPPIAWGLLTGFTWQCAHVMLRRHVPPFP
ncbi:MAG: hypothetical protein JWN70_692 [Planctomycetaceae bacterium]|nr:hypothetical protein [Planctomycetaceae bacterium]